MRAGRHGKEEGGTAAGAMAARADGRRPDDLTGEVALVTGGSRGLGLLIARELARRGCRLAIAARDTAELDNAVAGLRAQGAEVTAIACDITAADAPLQLVGAVVERFGRLDILVNNAGIIGVGPVQSTGPDGYEAAWQTMTFAPVRLTLAALPVMQRQEHGRIVNIASIGGKVSVPHLLPYCTAKFGLVGFSEGLRAELGRGPVTVTTVVPGLMRTGSHVHAEFTGHRDAEFTWFSLGASLPLLSMDAERAARRIVEAVRQRRSELILTPLAQVAARAAGLSPGLTGALLSLTRQLVLPAATAENGKPVPGRRLSPVLGSQAFGWLTSLGRAGVRRYNQENQNADEG